MTPILTAAEMNRADRRAIDEIGIPGPVLMENAARGCYEVIHELLGGNVPGKTMLILCGGGNNGGDGIAVARHGALHGVASLCLLLADPESIGSETRAQIAAAGSFPEIEILYGVEHLREIDGNDFDLIVDAMLGTGVTGAPRSPFDRAVAWANEQYRPAVAVDIPSGLHPDTGAVAGDVFRADVTVTMAALKPGLLLNEGPDVAGELFVAHIGTPGSLYDSASCRLIDADLAAEGLPVVARARHKYDRGKVLVLAGSRDMGGAGCMVSTAALAAGAGLSVYGMPDSIREETTPRLAPEIMTLGLPDHEGSFAGDAYDSVAERLGSYSIIALGPGIGRSEEAAAFARDVVRRSPLPVVLDADGLNAFTDRPDDLASHASPLVITPHYGEMSRLLGLPASEIAADPLEHARLAARRFDALVVLKGSPTVVASPDGATRINGAGNPGMATAGAGDVLTGVIGGLLAGRDRNDLLPGLLSAVYLHSSAGDIAAGERSVHSLRATDIIGSLPDAFRELEEE